MTSCRGALQVGTMLIASLAACGQKSPTPAPSAPLAASTSAAKASAAPVDEAVADREKRPRMGEAAVYVDGRPVGVLRHAELPSSLKPRTVDLGGGYTATRYSLTAYATALGLDVKKVRAVHLHGGSRISVVDAAEWARVGDRFSFSFLQGDHGKPRMHFPPVKLAVNTTIDLLSAITFYVEKEPPHLADGELVMPDGTSVAGKVAYASEEQGNGTRIYVDGRLVGTVKRKKLTADMGMKTPRASGDDAERYSLASYAKSLSPDTANAKSVELLAGDDLVARIDGAGARSLSFHVPPRNRGQAVLDLPTESGARAARITAVQLFVHAAPGTRTVTKLDDASEAAPAQGGGNQAGDDD